MIHFDINNLINEIKLLNEKTNIPNFWDNPEKSTPIVTKLRRLELKLEK